MEGGGGGRGEEDPFGSIINLCQITSSQELKLHTCPFALESENFPDAVDSLPSQFSPTPTPSDPPGIIMLSPPETEDEDEDEEEDEDDVPIDKSTPQENEEFQTPPEHHNLSTPSSQEDPQQLLKPITAVDERIDGSDAVETVAIDDGYGENEVTIDFGKRRKNLGSSETEELEDEVEGIEGFESELKKFRVFEDEVDEPVSKRIRVCEENWDSEVQTVCIDETEIREEIDDDEEEELIYLDVDEIDEGIGLNEDKNVINVDSAEPEINDGFSKTGEMQKKVSDGDNDSGGETEKVCCGCDGGVGNPGEEKKEEGGENNVMINGGLAVEGYEEGIRENGIDELQENGEEVSGCRNMEEIEKLKYKGRSGVNRSWKEKGAGVDGGEKSSLINEDLVVQASEKGVRNKWNDEVWKSSEEVFGCRNIEEIEQFRYKGSGGQCWKEVIRRKCELPLSLKEKGNDVGGKEKVSKVDAKNLSWKELLDAVAVVLCPVNDGSEDVDVLEAAKRKGMTFPHPRWI